LSNTLTLTCSKFPNNPNATQAFQKVSIAYEVLSTPSLKRQYDEHLVSASSTNPTAASSSQSAEYDVFARARPSGYAEDTLRSVVIGVFNDFLDNGDLEVIRNLLSAY
jgi:curved DNA-binding protein CbpA